ncbi:MAG TPA: acylneuraminate cytidylyltransferase family protein [Patescibacteria group bacterium]|nr:acylneuraminate cytidylyltransferase family protein [Patescibacteria group bacterium]
MYKNKKIAAIIPARKGSKGIPNKNITKLKGTPLIAYSIIQAKKSLILDKIIVSTDSEEIFNIAEAYEADIKGLRPEELSSDTAVLYDVLKYEVNNHRLIEGNFELIVLLQPTSPLRQSYMIDDALEQFIDEEQKSAVSVSVVEEHPIYMRTINQEGQLVKVLSVESTVRRQDLPTYYRVNGMIYINKISDILESYVSLNDNLSPIIIPKEYDIDIDDINDLIEAEKRLEQING